jgi:hypothetical protein
MTDNIRLIQHLNEDTIFLDKEVIMNNVIKQLKKLEQNQENEH